YRLRRAGHAPIFRALFVRESSALCDAPKALRQRNRSRSGLRSPPAAKCCAHARANATSSRVNNRTAAAPWAAPSLLTRRTYIASSRAFRSHARDFKYASYQFTCLTQAPDAHIESREGLSHAPVQTVSL